MSEERKILRVTSHYISWFQTCNLYFDRLANKGYIIPPSDPLMKGTLMHAALKGYYDAMKEGLSSLEGMQIGIKELNATILKGHEFDGHTEAITLSEEDIQLVQNTFLQYCAHHKDEKIDVVFTEEKLSKVLYESEKLVIIYEGQIDLLERRSGIVIPWDHKTESGKYPVSALTNQFVGYCFLTDSNMLKRNAIGLQKTKKAEEKFYRNLFNYPQTFIERWKHDVIEECFGILYAYETNKWPMRVSSCEKSSVNWFGCPFKDICLGDPDDWERSLNGNFKKTEELYSK